MGPVASRTGWARARITSTQEGAAGKSRQIKGMQETAAGKPPGEAALRRRVAGRPLAGNRLWRVTAT